MSELKSYKPEEIQDLPYPLPDNVDNITKVQVACRYILGLGVPTDIDYAKLLLTDAANQGNENAVHILKACE